MSAEFLAKRKAWCTMHGGLYRQPHPSQPGMVAQSPCVHSDDMVNIHLAELDYEQEAYVLTEDWADLNDFLFVQATAIACNEDELSALPIVSTMYSSAAKTVYVSRSSPCKVGLTIYSRRADQWAKDAEFKHIDVEPAKTPGILYIPKHPKVEVKPVTADTDKVKTKPKKPRAPRKPRKKKDDVEK